jgi:hypothetical protein
MASASDPATGSRAEEGGFMTAPIRLDGGGLLSKWGFSDGDLMIDWAWDNLQVEDAERVSDQHHDLLIDLVRERLVPMLAEWDVVVVEIPTLHNPIRARKIDGAEVDWSDPDFSHPIQHIEVTVSAEDIIRKISSTDRQEANRDDRSKGL